MNERVIHGGVLYLPILLTFLGWVLLRPHRRIRIAILMTTSWHAATLPWLNLWAQRQGWWQFQPHQLELFQIPLSFYIGWVVWWGMFSTLILGKLPHKYPLLWVSIGMIIFDLWTMPLLHPILLLGQGWLVGEALVIGIGFLPGLALAHFTMLDRRAEIRAWMISFAFALLAVGIAPFAIDSAPDLTISTLISQRSLILNCLFSITLTSLIALGLAGVREFAIEGRGTPIPFDPPKTLITTGIYRYLRNPMQTSMVLVLILWAIYLQSWLTFSIALISFIYSLGLARWSEESDLEARYGQKWLNYRKKVRTWLPSLEPQKTELATIYFDLQCDSCRDIAAWFSHKKLHGLIIADANHHPEAPLYRVTYESASGPPRQGVDAIACALGHIHLAWALLGWIAQIPGFLWLAEVIFSAQFSQRSRSAGE